MGRRFIRRPPPSASGVRQTPASISKYLSQYYDIDTKDFLEYKKNTVKNERKQIKINFPLARIYPMDFMNKTKSSFSFISKRVIIFVCVFMVLLMTALYMQGLWHTRKGELADADCYARLNRVVQLHETGKWYDADLKKSNAPCGEHLHWTRPLDLLLLTGAFLATPLAGFKDSLFWWGVLVSPFLLIASLMIIPWAFRPVLNDYDSNLMRLLFICQHGVISYYSVARPDHNSLLGLIFIITTGLILRLVQSPFNRTVCYFAGMTGAFSLWIHVESMLYIILILVMLGIFWISEDEDFDKKSVRYSLSLFTFTAVALFLERPWHDLASVEYDKISIVHLFIFGLISLFWAVVSSWKRHAFLEKGENQRLTIALLGAVTAALGVWLVFPDFYRGGYADADPRVVQLWLNNVSEVQSPLGVDYIRALIQLLASAFVGIFYIVFILRKKSDKNLRGWVFILSGILFFSFSGVLSRRLLLYGNIITVIPLAAVLGILLAWEKNNIKSSFRLFILPVTIISFCAAFLLPGYVCDKMTEKNNKPEQKKIKIPLAELCDELHFAIGEGNIHKPRILAFDFYGPEIVYRTGYEVVATPFHRNVRGILDAHGIMTAISDEEAHALIRQRGINLIIVNNDPSERKYYSRAPQGTIFYDRLQDGKYPDWIKKIELPPILSIQYKIFRVAG